MLTAGPDLVATWPGQTLIGDKNYFGAAFEATMASAGIKLQRPARKGEPARAGTWFFKPLRQLIESVFVLRVLQRILAPDRRHLAQRPSLPARQALAPGL